MPVAINEMVRNQPSTILRNSITEDEAYRGRKGHHHGKVDWSVIDQFSNQLVKQFASVLPRLVLECV